MEDTVNHDGEGMVAVALAVVAGTGMAGLPRKQRECWLAFSFIVSSQVVLPTFRVGIPS